MDKEIYNIKEIAAYLNKSVSGLRKLVREKRIPFFRAGDNRLKFNINDIKQWIEENNEAQTDY